MSVLGESSLSSDTPTYPLPTKYHQADYPPATYWPYMVNFKLHLYFPGGGVGGGGWLGVARGGNNQT